MKTLALRALPLALLVCMAPRISLSTEGGAPITLVATAHEADAGKAVMVLMSHHHLRPRSLDPGLSAQVFDALVDLIDPQRMLFTEVDIARLSDIRTRVGDTIDSGDLAPLMAPVNTYLNRLVEQQAFNLSLLNRPFDFTNHDSILIDRKSARRPASVDELHALWALRVKDDWLRLKLAGRKDDDVCQMLQHRYSSAASKVGKITSEDAFQMVMTAYANTMDPHTDYFAPKAASQFNTAMSLSLEGIGAYLRAHDDYAQVTELSSGSPSATSGLVHIGDRVLAVGQGSSGSMVDVTGWPLDDVVGLIRGKSGTSVRLELLLDESKGDVASRTITLVRRHVSMDDQAATAHVITVGSHQGARKVGVLSVPSFYEDFDAKRKGGDYRSVSKDVAAMLAGFRKEHVDGVVLDLRDNGGGSLTEAISLGSLFSGSGPVVQVVDSSGSRDVEQGAGSAQWTGPLVVMVNRASASASEILAAALQDRGRGVVVGERSFGKGTVQNLIDLDPLLHGSGYGELKMTIAQFYRINGSTTQLDGVKPDIPFPETYGEKEFGESTYKNALPASTVDSAVYDKEPGVGKLLPLIIHSHEQRIASDTAWQIAVERLQAYRNMADRQTLSLNYEERKAAREADARTLSGLRKREDALALRDGRPLDKPDAVSDDGLMPSERALDPAGRRKPGDRDDAFLRESAEIVEDEAMLMSVMGGPKTAG